MALPIIVPIAYIVTLLAGLAAFSKVYRRRESKRLQAYQQSSSASQEVNPQRAIYRALADIQEEFPDGDAKDNRWLVPRATLQGALLARAVEVLRSMNELRSDKQALAALLERGSVGDDAAVLLETMDNDIRKEVMEIVREAGRFDPSWSKLLFQSANEVLANLRCRDILLDITKQREEEIAKTRQLGLPVPTIGQT
ncbi:Translocation protein S66 [Malassezia yamatoensis]|uniref:Translocation protein S66 n=1 Tax=Malassezia yamatoensis TaxID=253288 RepID=A0AAJ5YR13_9BASI|nr:Translocation protein S66 [Malassezia yamatoensis]